MELAVRRWPEAVVESDGPAAGREVLHLDGFWPPVVVLGGARGLGTVSTVPGRISDGFAPMTSALA
jgi:hypothetical protein